MSKNDKMSTILFNKSLATMVKGIRNHKDKGESEYIAKCIAEIKEELASSYLDVKANALRKLIYLQMLGHDMSWASFRIIEVMSSANFTHKRIGYLAAALSFTKDTDVILLTTHLFRKGFTQNVSGDSSITDGLQYEIGAAIGCLANIATPGLAEDLLSDIYGMMNSSRPYIRKKAVLVLLKIFHQYPKALRMSFDRLKEKLNDENQGVVSAAVYVICELASRNPKNYLSLAPQFFKILTSSSNNWVLIKVVKLLGSLVPLEPRLAKKLVEPLTDIITTTPAKSLLYECVNTLLSGKISSKTVIRLCLEKLRTFIENPDQNLKYLGLLGLHKLMKAHPRAVVEHKDLILDCLNDDDVTIRMRALDLITSMVTKRNLMGIVRRLIEHLELSDGSYREHVLERILFVCAQNNFAFVADFEWYISMLVDLTHLHAVSRDNALRINNQLMEVVIRVPAVRKYGVQQMVSLLLSGRLLSASSSQNAMCEVLYAAAWIVGEFSDLIESRERNSASSPVASPTAAPSSRHADLLRSMLQPQLCALSVAVQNVFVHSALKVFAAGLAQPYDLDAAEEAALARQREADRQRELKQKEEEKKRLQEESKQEASVDDMDPLDLSGKPVEQPQGLAAPGEEPEEEKSSLSKTRSAALYAVKRSFAQWLSFVEGMLEVVLGQLPLFTHSNAVEVQERAVTYLEFLKWFSTSCAFEPPALAALLSSASASSSRKDKNKKKKQEQEEHKSEAPVVADVLGMDGPAPVPMNTDGNAPSSPSASTSASAAFPSLEARKQHINNLVVQFAALFAEPLNPVNPKAQKHVPVPAGLDLDAWINEEPKDESDDDDGYSLEEDGGRKSKSRKDKKGRSGKDKKGKSSRDRDEYDYEEESYVKNESPEEIEAAKQRRADIKARQAHDPFYIPDFKPATQQASSSTSLLSGANATSPTGDVDDIPIQRLPKGTLPDLHLEKRNSRRHRRRFSEDEQRPRKDVQYTVNVDEEMPEGAVLEDENKGGSDDELNQDLDAPLGADEVISKVKSYAEYKQGSGVTAAAEDKKSKSKSKSKRSKDDKDKKGKKDKKDKKDKSDKKDKKEKSDKKEKKDKKNKDSKEEDSAASVSVSAPAPTSALPSVLDMFDPIASPPAVPKAKAQDKPEEKESGEGDYGKDALKRPSADKPRDLYLYKDSTIRITYASRFNGPASGPNGSAKQPTSLVLVSIEYRKSASSSGKKPSKTLASLTLNVSSGNKTRVTAVPGKESQGKSTAKGASIVLKNLEKGRIYQEMLKVDFLENFERPGFVSASLSYEDAKGKGKSDRECEIVLPWSVFVQPKRLSSTDFAAIIPSCPHTAAKKVALGELSVGDALKNVCPLLNIALVEALNFNAMYYGQLVTDQRHVAVMIKANKNDNSNIQVEIKTASQALSNSLMEEVVSYFK